jgi:hypothetical protein
MIRQKNPPAMQGGHEMSALIFRPALLFCLPVVRTLIHLIKGFS